MTQSCDDVAERCQRLKILANPNRLRILLFLLDREASVSDIGSALEIKQPNLSHELRKLRDADMVVTSRESKEVFYRLKSDSVKILLLSVCQSLDSFGQSDEDYSDPGAVAAKGQRGVECGLFAVIPLRPAA